MKVMSRYAKIKVLNKGHRTYYLGGGGKKVYEYLIHTLVWSNSSEEKMYLRLMHRSCILSLHMWDFKQVMDSANNWVC